MITSEDILSEKYLDLLHVGKLADLLAQVVNEGYGTVTLKVDIKMGKIAFVFITRTHSFRGEEFDKPKIEGYEDLT